jgi:NhaP-type Na+/H+ or K+/H+ antiporter
MYALDDSNRAKFRPAKLLRILYSLLPPLLFESAFNVNYHVFIKVLKSSLMLATSGVVLSTGLLGCVFMLIFPHEFSMIEKCNPGCAGYAPDPTCSSHHGDTSGPINIDCSADGWIAAFMFGAIVSATDPVAVVAALQSLGASPKLSHLIEGESLLNDGSAVVVFIVCKGLVTHQIDHLDGEPTGAGQTVVSIFLMLIRLALGGVALGYIFSYIVYSWLRVSRRLNASIEISIMVVSVYLVFYLSEHWFGASGVLTTVVFGLNLAKRRHLAMTVDTEEKNEIVWEEIGYVANSFVFALAGVILWRIVMEDNVFAHTEVHATGTDSAHGGTEAGHSRRLDGGGHDSNETAHGLTTALSDEYSFGGHLLFSVFLYFIMLAVRLSTILLHYRCMRKVTRPGYQVEIKEAFFMAFAGLRGAVSLCVAMQVDHMPIDHRVKDIILFHTCMCVFFTVLVNGSSAPWVYAKLGLGVMDTTHADLDTGAVQLLDEKLNEWCKTALKEEWAFREPNIANEDRSGVLNRADLRGLRISRGRYDHTDHTHV